MPTTLVVLALLAWLTLVVGYIRGGRGRPWEAYAPRWAWWRAGIFFATCFVISYASGAMDLILTRPVATGEQLENLVWIAVTAGLVVFIVGAYSVMWVRFTVVFDRPRSTLTSVVFGVLWGMSVGQLFLSVWLVAQRTGLPTWGAVALTYAVLGAWQYNWHSIYWDHYVTPEHDTPLTLKVKTFVGHIPNLALTLTYVAVWDNYLIFVGLQVIAVTSAAVGMHLPPPWAPASVRDLAHRTTGPIPRVFGYLSPDPTTDPYTPFYPGWHDVPEPVAR